MKRAGKLRSALGSFVLVSLYLLDVSIAQSAPPSAKMVPAVAQNEEVTRGVRLFSQQKWDESIDIMHPVWVKGIRSYHIAYYIGASHCNKGRYDKAQIWFDHAINRMSPPPRALQMLRRAATDCTGLSKPRLVFNSDEWTYSGELLYLGSDPRRRLRMRSLSGAEAMPGSVLAKRLIPTGGDATRTIKELIEDLTPRKPRGEGCARNSNIIAQMSPSGRFLFVTREPTNQRVLNAWGLALDTYVESLSQRFGMDVPDKVITVHLARCPQDAQMIASLLHGLEFEEDEISGYSVQEDMSLMAIWKGNYPDVQGHLDSKTMRTIRHEISHLMMHRWFGDAPGWLDEGLAQYLGVTAVDPVLGHSTVLHSDWGALPALDKVIAPVPDGEDACAKVADLMMKNDVARMFLAYVDSQPDRLATLMRNMRNYIPDADTPISDRAQVESALGKTLQALEADYQKANRVHRDNSQFGSTGGETCPT